MIGYGTGKIILKLPPFWISKEELQEREIQMKTQTQTNTSQLLRSITLLWLLNFPALDIPCSIGRKAGISKWFFLFRTLSYITLFLPENVGEIVKLEVAHICTQWHDSVEIIIILLVDIYVIQSCMYDVRVLFKSVFKYKRKRKAVGYALWCGLNTS